MGKYNFSNIGFKNKGTFKVICVGEREDVSLEDIGKVDALPAHLWIIEKSKISDI